MGDFDRRFVLRGLGALGMRMGCGGFPRQWGFERQAELLDYVRVLTRASTDEALRETVKRARAGWSHERLLAGVFVAGVQEIAPDPVGFKFHCVMVVPSALALARSAGAEEALLPVLFNVADFKRSQAEDAAQGDFTLPPVRPAPAERATLRVWLDALESYDLEAADAAVPSLVGEVPCDELFEELWRFGVRDFHNLGHKIIYTLHVKRMWESCGDGLSVPGLRSLTRALMAGRGREPGLGFEASEERAARQAAAGIADRPESVGVLANLRTDTPLEARDRLADLRAAGVPAAGLWDDLRLLAAEIHLRHPGLLAVHPMTTLSAMATVAATTRRPATAELMLLTCAAWMAGFREYFAARGGERELRIDGLSATDAKTSAAELFELSDPAQARSAAVALAARPEGVRSYLAAFERRVIRKASEHHYPKYAVALGEELGRIAPRHRGSLLAAGLSYVPKAGQADTELVRAFEDGAYGSPR